MSQYFVSHRGVSKIRLVDFDYVTLSSLNRHATACLADVGTPKVKCIERTLKQISRWVNIDARLDIWRKEDGGKLLEGADWVIGKTFGRQLQIIADSTKMPSTISPLRSTY
jgi:tRNA A37 threonylcarbamoyladenosine dehydratase